jgi:hypothetical protein
VSEAQHTASQQDISKEAILAALQKVLQSKIISHSASLRDTLNFIVRNNLSSPHEPIKEYSIATEVLGRGRDFDPKIDNIVRVQMYRLREKLEDYYLTDGQQESIRIVIPRGGYSPEFQKVDPNSRPPLAESLQTGDIPRVENHRWLWGVTFALAACCLVLAVTLLWRKSHPPSIPLPSSLVLVWQPFLSPDSPPLIVYSNPVFFMTKRGDLRRYDSPTILFMPRGSIVPTMDIPEVHPARGEETGPYYYCDAYTGTGEVAAAAAIVQFLTAHGEPYLIKRSRIASYEEIRNKNAIFLGSEKEDQILKNLPNVAELVYQPPPPNQYSTGSFIHDLKPPPGHPADYRLQLDPTTSAIQVDYGLISVLPGVSKGHYVLVLGGITTLATQASADFVTSPDDMAIVQQMQTASTPKKPRSGFFQVLFEVQVRDGVPLATKFLLVRDLNQPGH